MGKEFVPRGLAVPTRFEGRGFHLEPLGPEHNERDHAAWMTSIDHIRSAPGMEGREWPAPMTLEENMGDMEMHAREFAERKSFTYSILDGSEVIGCVYIYPSDDPGLDADVRSWVRVSRADMDATIRSQLCDWLETEWPFEVFAYAPGSEADSSSGDHSQRNNRTARNPTTAE